MHGAATSQTASNELREAGVHLAANTTSACTPISPKRRNPAGELLLLDEASMMSMTDLAQIMNLAANAAAGS